MEQYQHLVTLAGGLGPKPSGGQVPTIDSEELEAKRAEAYQEHAAIEQMTLQFNDLCTRLKEELAKNQHLLHQQQQQQSAEEKQIRDLLAQAVSVAQSQHQIQASGGEGATGMDAAKSSAPNATAIANQQQQSCQEQQALAMQAH